ncbi:LON peptidase substrate-binding domain-containing protein [Halomonas denitrificans]|nr:LON peptidase substrate-binding domain-containing protein [Halomonas denitrificans]
MTDALDELALFPLQLVLFPGAPLPLRIFETRYLELVRDCSRSGQGFGVVMLDPATDQRTARHASIGTEAVIEDFSTLEDGLLGIRARGTRRFRIHHTSARDNGLLIGHVEWIAPEPARSIGPEFAALESLYRELVARLPAAELPEVEADNASQLGMALAGILPLDPPQAQELLAVSDPEERLRALCWLLGPDDASDAVPD